MPPNQEVPTRPPSSPTSPNQDHLTRTISFAASSSPPPSRPATSSSRKTSDTPSFSPTKSGLGKGREGTATTKLAWTDTQEERLIFVRSELKKAQRRWSESQEVWLAEEQALLELKTLHKKALKKEAAAAKKAAGIWKRKTWGRSRIGSMRSSRKNSTIDVPQSSGKSVGHDGPDDENDNDQAIDDTFDDGDADDEHNNNDIDDEEDEELGDGNGLPLEKTSTNSSTLSNAIRRLSFSVRSRRGTATGTSSRIQTPGTVTGAATPIEAHFSAQGSPGSESPRR